MNIKTRNITISISAIVAGLLIGCGGGGGDNSSPAPAPAVSTLTGSYTVSVIDDNVIGATVSAPECAISISNGNGSYTLKECVSAPAIISAVGGFVDTNANGVQDTDEVGQAAPLILKTSQSGVTNAFVVTPLTTLASQESTDLSSLATSLGVTQADLFKDNTANRSLMRAVNAVLISARTAGITKYDTFVADFKELIKNKGSLNAAKADMMDPAKLIAYKAKYGVVFGGFVDDTTGIDLTSNPLASVKAKNTVTAGKIKLGGFVYDGILPNAAISCVR